MSTLAVGKDILSHCTKCKLLLSHLIVVMKDDRTIGKVKCNTCQSIHAYKSQSSAAKAKSGVKKLSKKKRDELKTQNLWSETITNTPDDEVETYGPKSRYLQGQVINHPKFGKGLVEKLIDNNKIEVIFKSDTKTLMHGL